MTPGPAWAWSCNCHLHLQDNNQLMMGNSRTIAPWWPIIKCPVVGQELFLKGKILIFWTSTMIYLWGPAQGSEQDPSLLLTPKVLLYLLDQVTQETNNQHGMSMWHLMKATRWTDSWNHSQRINISLRSLWAGSKLFLVVVMGKNKEQKNWRSVVVCQVLENALIYSC